jgi:uncharacterized protein (TIGR01777 family)
MHVSLTGATGLIGSRLAAALLVRGDAVTVLSRNPERARAALGDVEAHAWNPVAGPAPVEALNGRDAVVHLAGETLSQRWTAESRRAIQDSRVLGTRNLVAGLRDADPRPRTLVCASGVGYYGPCGDERVTEDSAPGSDFGARLCVAWEREAAAARELGIRVVSMRTAVVLDSDGGAMAKMLPFFRLGIGGPVAGGRQYLPWIHVDDIVDMYLAAIDDGEWDGPFNASAPEPPTNRDFSRALGRALHRPAVLPVPGFALQLLYGDMAQIVTTGQRAVPARALERGYSFRHTDLEAALRDAVA